MTKKIMQLGTRLVEPYAVGMTSAGNVALRGYQYNGDTVRGVPKWKLFRLDRILSWKTTNDRFNVEPRKNGWNAEPYNPIGDGLMSVSNQVRFDNGDDYYSPSNRLNDLRMKTQRMKQSNPININDFNKQNNQSTKQLQQQPNANKQGAIANNVTQGIVKNNNDDFNNMLKRNLTITDKEKQKRGFSLSSNNNVNRGAITKQQNNDKQNTANNNSNANRIGAVDNSEFDNNKEIQQNQNNQHFNDMLKRNLAITDKEKQRRGFSLNNKNQRL